MIFDRDKKSVNDFWKHIFDSLNVNLIYFTIWHFQTDGICEIFNQTIEIIFRYYIATFENIRTWPKILSRMSISLNNLTNYNSTAQALNQIFYGFRIKNILDLFVTT